MTLTKVPAPQQTLALPTVPMQNSRNAPAFLGTDLSRPLPTVPLSNSKVATQKSKTSLNGLQPDPSTQSKLWKVIPLALGFAFPLMGVAGGIPVILTSLMGVGKHHYKLITHEGVSLAKELLHHQHLSVNPKALNWIEQNASKLVNASQQEFEGLTQQLKEHAGELLVQHHGSDYKAHLNRRWGDKKQQHLYLEFLNHDPQYENEFRIGKTPFYEVLRKKFPNAKWLIPKNLIKTYSKGTHWMEHATWPRMLVGFAYGFITHQPSAVLSYLLHIPKFFLLKAENVASSILNFFIGGLITAAFRNNLDNDAHPDKPKREYDMSNLYAVFQPHSGLSAPERLTTFVRELGQMTAFSVKDNIVAAQCAYQNLTSFIKGEPSDLQHLNGPAAGKSAIAMWLCYLATIPKMIFTLKDPDNIPVGINQYSTATTAVAVGANDGIMAITSLASTNPLVQFAAVGAVTEMAGTLLGMFLGGRNVFANRIGNAAVEVGSAIVGFRWLFDALDVALNKKKPLEKATTEETAPSQNTDNISRSGGFSLNSAQQFSPALQYQPLISPVPDASSPAASGLPTLYTLSAG